VKDDSHIWIWGLEGAKPVQAPFWKKVLCATHQDWILIGYYAADDEPDALIELCPKCTLMKVMKQP
jgi:hypothetical protein